MKEPGSKRRSGTAGTTTTSWLQSLLIRLLLAAVAWWIVSEGQAPLLGLTAAIAAVALSLWLAPPTAHSPRPLGLLYFLGYFLLRSCIASLDVAARIVHPRLLVDPFVTRVPLSLPPGPPRVLLVDTLNLLPGTLSVAQQGDTLVLHCLSSDSDAGVAVRAMEKRVAALFGLPAGDAS